MAWTTPETFTAGQTLTAASMNAISGNLDALNDGRPSAVTPVCILTDSGQSISNVTDTAITGYTETLDTDGMYDAGSPTRITINTAGVYVITANVLWSSTATRTDLYVKIDGGSATRWRDIRYSTSERNHITFTLAFTAGQYLEAYVYQNSGGSRNASTDFAATFVSSGA